MMVTTRGSLLRMLLWQWRSGVAFVAMGLVAVGVQRLGFEWATLPSLPVSVAGSTLGFFVAFRTNNAYERWWEGRRLWGGLVNASRLFASQALAYLPREDAERLIRRHLGYVHWLRCALRDQPPARTPRWCVSSAIPRRRIRRTPPARVWEHCRPE